MWYSRWERRVNFGANLKQPKIFLITVLFLLVGLVAWSCFADMDTVVRAEGRVVPLERSQLIQHLEGGVIDEVVIAEGSIVKRGDLLMRVGDQLGSSGLNEKKVRILALRARIERLSAEAMGLNKLTLPADLMQTQEGRAEESSFIARKTHSEQEQKVVEQQILQRKAEIEEQKNRKSDLQKEALLAQKKLELVARLVKENAASRLELLDEQVRVQRFDSQIRDTEIVLPKLRSSIAEFEGRLSELKNRFKAEAQSDLSTSRAELSRLNEEIVAGSDRVRRAEIRAPVAGVVNRIYLSTKGGVIKSGETLMEITPVEDRVIVEGRVKPSDRAELVPGLNSRVRLSAYDFGLFGAVPGKLSEISADTLADERGERFYRVKVNLDLTGGALGGRPVLPGMIVTADIVTGKRPVIAFFLSRVFKFSRNAFSELR